MLRIEDIDRMRCTPALETQMLQDLQWLGIEWDEEPRRQSQHFATYREAIETLEEANLLYPSFMSRREIRETVEARIATGAQWPHDPDGTPHYPGPERSWLQERRAAEQLANPIYSLRLDTTAAQTHAPGPYEFEETGSGPNGENGVCLGQPEEWGDVVLARSDTPASYHLCCVVDDALQGITHVVRGRDLFAATGIHRLLQDCLGLPVPVYHHHDLILGQDGRKLSKSAGDTSLRMLRDAGMTPHDIMQIVGLDA